MHIVDEFSFRPKEDEIAPLPQDTFQESTGYQNNLLYLEEPIMSIEEYKTPGFGDGNEVGLSQLNFDLYPFTGNAEHEHQLLFGTRNAFQVSDSQLSLQNGFKMYRGP